MGRPRGQPQLTPLALLGFAVASGGGPLAVAGIYLLANVAVAPEQLFAASLVGLVLFAAPLIIWLDYARDVSSGGGLSAFVERAAGRRLAVWHGWIWTVSYLLYLPYTVTYIVFYLLPSVVPVSRLGLDVLELLLPAGLSLLAGGARSPFAVLLVFSGVQLSAVGALGVLTLRGPGLRDAAVAVHSASWTGLLASGAQVASLLICVSLVLFLGGEAMGGARAMRRTLVGAFAILGAVLVFSSLLLAAGTTRAVAASDLPGVSLMDRYGGPAIAAVFGLLILGSVAGLVVAEFVALSRLWGMLLCWPKRRVTAVIAAVFLGGDLLSLLGPLRFYRLTLMPSLVALYLAQLPVFLLYPRFAQRRVRPLALPVALATVASLWALYGMYGALIGGGSS